MAGIKRTITDSKRECCALWTSSNSLLGKDLCTAAVTHAKQDDEHKMAQRDTQQSRVSYSKTPRKGIVLLYRKPITI